MDLRELELTIEATLATNRPRARDLRDVLVDYFLAVGRPFMEKGLEHTHPDADERLVRRLLLVRLGSLWRDLGTRWDDPSVADLAVFRRRIDAYACVRPDDESLARARRLIDSLQLAVTVTERLLGLTRPAPARRLMLIDGGGERTEPRGRLELVRPAERGSG